MFPSSPYLGKGSSLELQGVEPNVYILFCLCSHPVRRFEESEKNLLLYLGLSPALLFDDGGQSKDWTGGGKQWSKRDLGVDCSSWLVLAGRYLLAFGPSFSPSSTALELRLLLCLGSVASIVTGLGPSTHDLQHPDLLPEVLVQLLEAGGGTECGYKATALWG